MSREKKSENSAGTYFKVVSMDWRFFVYSITKSRVTLKEPYLSDRQIRDPKDKLPYGRRIDGVYPVSNHPENKHKKPLFDEQTKQGWLINKQDEQSFPFPFSKHQSTSYYREGFYSPAFPGLIDKAETCFGISCPAKMESSDDETLPYTFQDAKNIHALSPPNRVMLHNNKASFERYYLSASREEAEKAYQEEIDTNRFFYSTDDLVKRGNQRELNEIMLRLRWICDGNSQLTAFRSTNPLATNIELQIKAHDLAQRLKAWHQECGLHYPQNYKVPLGSYVPGLEGYRCILMPTPPTVEEQKTLENISVISQEPFTLTQYNDKGKAICTLDESELKALGLNKGVEPHRDQLDALDAAVLRKGGRAHQSKPARKYTIKQQRADFEYALQLKTKKANPKSYDLARFLELQRNDFHYEWSKDGYNYNSHELVIFIHLAADLTYESSLLFYQNFILENKEEIDQALKEANKLHLYIDIYRCIPPHRRKEFIAENISDKLMPFYIHSLLKSDGLKHDTDALLELTEAKSGFKFDPKGEKINPVLVAALNQKSYAGEEQVISYLIKHGAQVSAPYGQDSPLKIAAKQNKPAIVNLLLVQGASSFSDQNGACPLHWAVGKGHEDIAFSLIKHDTTSLSRTDKEGNTPLHWGIKNGHLGLVKKIINNLNEFRINSDEDEEIFNFKEDHNSKLLSLAIEKKDLELVKLLQQQGTILQDKDRLSLIALYIANNEFESAATLLNSEDLQNAQDGVNAEIIKQHGGKALAWAVENKRSSLCQFLLLNNVTPTPESVSFLEKKLGPLLHLAIKNKNVGLVKRLIENKSVDVNAVDSQSRTPLYNAAIESVKKSEIFKNFENGLDESQLERLNQLVAEKNASYYEIIDLLLKQGQAYCYPPLGEQHPYLPPPEVMKKKTRKNAAIVLILTTATAYGIYALVDFIKNDPAAKAYLIDNAKDFIALGSFGFVMTLTLTITAAWLYSRLKLRENKPEAAQLIEQRLASLANNKINTVDSKLSLSTSPSAEGKEKKGSSEELGLIPTSPAIEATPQIDNAQVISSIKKEINIFANKYSKDEQKNTALRNLIQYPPLLVAKEWYKNKLEPNLICPTDSVLLYPSSFEDQIKFEKWVTEFSRNIYELKALATLTAKKSIGFFPPADENLVGSSNTHFTPASQNPDGP